MKEQRGFRLETEVLKRIDRYCERLDASYNSVISQCIRLGLPLIESPVYYHVRVNGITPEMLGEEFAKFVAQKHGPKKG
jgi:hypothetical protein